MVEYTCIMDSSLQSTIERPYMELAEVELKVSEGLTTSDSIETLLTDIAIKFDLQLLETVIYEFEPHGITGLAVVGESHIAVHTWPERDYCHVLMSSCAALPSTEDIVAAFEAWGHAVVTAEKQVNDTGKTSIE